MARDEEVLSVEAIPNPVGKELEVVGAAKENVFVVEVLLPNAHPPFGTADEFELRKFNEVLLASAWPPNPDEKLLLMEVDEPNDGNDDVAVAGAEEAPKPKVEVEAEGAAAFDPKENAEVDGFEVVLLKVEGCVADAPDC